MTDLASNSTETEIDVLQVILSKKVLLTGKIIVINSLMSGGNKKVTHT